MLGGTKRKAARRVARFAPLDGDAFRLRPCKGTIAGAPDAFCRRGLRRTMANNPKKAKDPTEVALSAIQEALNISESNADSNRNAEAADLSPPPVMPPAASSFEPRTSAADRP